MQAVNTNAIPNRAILLFASNNIYEQQYQTHRFAVEYYRKPVAVNDIGYVSYENKNYVLDLAGLGSMRALVCRDHGCNPGWMSGLAKMYNVQLAMIYSDWFRGLPANWVKVGELRLGKTRVTPAESRVSFYALNSGAFSEAVREIREFRETLPVGAKFIFNTKSSRHI